MREEADHEVVLPQEVERNDSGSDIGGELRGVDLVKENFFLQGHSSGLILSVVRQSGRYTALGVRG